MPLVVDDLYSLDAAVLSDFQPLHALIFLFKWVSTGSAEPSIGGQYDPDFPGFFAHQVVNNACATLAVMNAIANIPGLQMGAQLSDLFAFTAGMDPQTSGMAITSSDWLREAHNALSPPSSPSSVPEFTLESLTSSSSTSAASRVARSSAISASRSEIFWLPGTAYVRMTNGVYQARGGLTAS